MVIFTDTTWGSSAASLSRRIKGSTQWKGKNRHRSFCRIWEIMEASRLRPSGHWGVWGG